jgi:hypothetical protein
VEAGAQQVSADDWDALTYPLPVAPRAVQDCLRPNSSSSNSTEVFVEHPPHAHKNDVVAAFAASSLQAVAAAAAAEAEGGDSTAAAGAAVATPAEYSPPVVQDFYILTSRPGSLASTSMLPAPLRASVLTEGDMLALQHAQQQHQQQQRGLAGANSSSSGGDCGFDEHAQGQFDFDIFCSSSSSSGRMGLSVVARESAGLDNVFVGLTTRNQADQRGLQVCVSVCLLCGASNMHARPARVRRSVASGPTSLTRSAHTI